MPFAAAGAALLVLVVCGGAALAVGVGHPSHSAASSAATADGPLMAAVTNASEGTNGASVAHDSPAAAGVATPHALSRQWTGVAPGTGPDADLASGLDVDLAGIDGDVAVAVKDLASGRGAVLNGDREQPAASLYKLDVLYSVFDLGLSLSEPLAITQDALSYDTGSMELGAGETLTVAEVLERMVVLSDNTSGVMLGSRVGGSRINALMAALGLEATHYGADQMTTSATDMLALIESMARGRAVSPAASADMIHLLLRQRVNDRLPRLLPADVQVAHKTGNLPGVVNDVGILYGPSQTIAIAAMIAGTTDEVAASTAIARVADTAYTYFSNGSVDARRPIVPPAPDRPIPPVWREPRPVPTATPTAVEPRLAGTATPPHDLAGIADTAADPATPSTDPAHRTPAPAATVAPPPLAPTPTHVVSAPTVPATATPPARAALAPTATPASAPRTPTPTAATPPTASPTLARR